MALYYTRHDSMTQATTTFAPVETDSEGATAGPIPLDPSVRRIISIRATCVVDGAQATDTGFIIVLRLSGTGAVRDGPQELVLYVGHLNDGGGTLTYTASVLAKTLYLPVSIEVNGGTDLVLGAAYYAADPGSPQLSVTLEAV